MEWFGFWIFMAVVVAANEWGEVRRKKMKELRPKENPEENQSRANSRGANSSGEL